ncbi:unnamed protein product [Thelazia callipaeda]|uniref:START domain-containing protein n=1 Tax=Thelazia callipaeda TaxID=103827 RepID=A0A0N5CQ15_THECL|nr:unnamed protein product [Thelazia callipaeda]
MTTINVGGLRETLPAKFERYSEAFKKAENAMKLLLDVCTSPDFEAKEGWSKSYEKHGEQVYYKQFNVGKIFSLMVIFNETIQSLFSDHWDRVSTTIKWNPNIAYMHKIMKLTSHCDILRCATTNIMFVKGREFLTCRLYRKIGTVIYVAARSFEIDEMPETEDKVRADLILGGGRFSPLPQDPQKTRVDYTICVNPKIRLPQRIIDTCIAYSIHRDSVFARKRMHEVAESQYQEDTQASEKLDDLKL